MTSQICDVGVMPGNERQKIIVQKESCRGHDVSPLFFFSDVPVIIYAVDFGTLIKEVFVEILNGMFEIQSHVQR